MSADTYRVETEMCACGQRLQRGGLGSHADLCGDCHFAEERLGREEEFRDDGQPWIEARCKGCQGPPGELTPCPYAEELYGEDKPCNCCDECRRACVEEA